MKKFFEKISCEHQKITARHCFSIVSAFVVFGMMENLVVDRMPSEHL